MAKAIIFSAMTQTDVQGCSWFASPQKFAYCENALFAWRKPSMCYEAGNVAASWPNIYKFNIRSTANAEESGVQDFFSPRVDGGNAHTHGAARSGEAARDNRGR